MYARETPVRAEALAALLDVLSDELPEELRAEAARHLAGIHDPAVKARFEQLAAEGDTTTTEVAARYLAAWEGLDLCEGK